MLPFQQSAEKTEDFVNCFGVASLIVGLLF